MSSGRAENASAEIDEIPMPEIDANGVDRVQIRRHLDLSPGERLRHLEIFVASVIRIRTLNERAEISRDPSPPR